MVRRASGNLAPFLRRPALSAAPTATLLAVDDSADVLQLLAGVLRDEYRLRVANSGAKGLAAVAVEPRPDLILLDVAMPEFDGFAVCAALKADPATADIPVIFLTGNSDADTETRCFALGAADFIAKPINPNVLRARVRTQLALQRALARAREEQQKADAMLKVVLPAVAADELRVHGTLAPRRAEGVAVMFVDVVGFTTWCSRHSPEDVVAAVHRTFSAFEGIARRHGLEKLKTIGDSMMTVGGLLTPLPDPLLASVRCGLDMVHAIRALAPEWQLRVGVHQGPVVAGIVGTERFQFDVWGDTVNVAARLASVGAPDNICVTHEAFTAIADHVVGVDGGVKHLKGRGDAHVFEILGLRPPTTAAASSS
jgi:class 3 adenylate cyclase